MNAALGIAMMVFGHYILPDSDDHTPRLFDDPSIQMNVQDAQVRYTTRRMRLPQAPTLAPADDYQSRVDRRNATNSTGYGASSRTRNDPGAVPQPPTDPYATSGVRGLPTSTVSTPGSQQPNGYNQAYNNAGAGGSGGSAYNQRSAGSSGVGNFIAPTATTAVGSTYNTPNLGQYRAPTAQQYISQSSNGALNGGSSYGGGYSAASYGSGANNSSGGYSSGDSRPFAGQSPLAPTYSPYLGLYNTRTNNGTIDAYHSAVLPQVQQNQFNNQVTARINGVSNNSQSRGFGPTGGEAQMGNGLANPSQFINYGNFGNTQGYYPQNP